jgi:hypothetical protein
MKLSPHAAGLYPLLDPHWRAKIHRGALVLLLPVVGWPAVLGYRARLVRHFFGPAESALPDWESGFGGYLADGLRAMAVIFGYASPVYAALSALLVSRGWTPGTLTLVFAATSVVLPMFAPLALPAACAWLALAEPQWLAPHEAALFFAAYALVIFLVPAGFLQVSLTRRYRSAFALWRTLPFVARHLRAYVAAWRHSLVMVGIGHFAVPFTPWGVVWGFIGILVVFNELLVRAELAPGDGWLARALADDRFARGRAWTRRELVDAANEPASVLDLPGVSVPLPRWPR